MHVLGLPGFIDEIEYSSMIENAIKAHRGLVRSGISDVPPSSQLQQLLEVDQDSKVGYRVFLPFSALGTFLARAPQNLVGIGHSSAGARKSQLNGPLPLSKLSRDRLPMLLLRPRRG